MEWQPLFSGSSGDRCFALVEKLASCLREPSTPSLAAGSAGVGLFLAYFAEASQSEEILGRGVAMVERSVEAMAEEEIGWDLFSGFAGIAWIVQHLQRHFLGGEDLNGEIDEAVTTLVSQRRWSGPYDLAGGLTGLGVYALERRSPTTLRQIVARFGDLAEPVGDGISWKTSPEWLPDEARRRFPRGEYNLGIAHGVPGVIALLSSIHAAGIERDRTAHLIRGAVRWVLGCALAGDPPSRFAYHWIPGEPQGPSRLGWCYGDLSVATALRLAAAALDEPDWEREAIAIALHAADRSPADSKVEDAGLCHGAAGVGHLFNRFYQSTQNETFAAASRLWFDRAIEMLGGPDLESDFLTGAAGSGLALLAALGGQPRWDSVLLLSYEA